jgi:hypothetical protein
MDRYVTEEQRSRRPIFIATLRAARFLKDSSEGQPVASLDEGRFALLFEEDASGTQGYKK